MPAIQNYTVYLLGCSTTGIMRLTLLAIRILTGLSVAGQARARNSSYFNPILPGWHSDPS